MTFNENPMITNKHMLICLDKTDCDVIQIDYLLEHFCGKTLTKIDTFHLATPDTLVYLCGDIQKIIDTNIEFRSDLVYIISDLSTNFDNKYQQIRSGEVPINIHGVGIYFRNLFLDTNYFESISTEHEFQNLTESNKPNFAYRKAIYLSKVEETVDGLMFNILRCSSNLTGGTDNFRKTDINILDIVNCLARLYFRKPVEINHVLAQIYYNSEKSKAKIKAHSDKTKDMDPAGLIVFCTFYESITNNLITQSNTDPYDYVYKHQTSVLTELVFKKKPSVIDPYLVKEFRIKLYPNSCFMINLETNRNYTHEIRPSTLPGEIIPTRLGYVCRNSNVKAVHRDGKTYIMYNDQEIPMRNIDKNGAQLLRNKYFIENTTAEKVDYPFMDCSMNSGDLQPPMI